MADLKGKTALVTGASRGIGRGAALALAEAGARVWLTGRTTEEGKGAVHLPGSVFKTAEEIRSRGGTATPLPCDHRDDSQVQAVFEQIAREEGKLDILVNGVWGGYEQFANGSEYTGHLPFWQKGMGQWDSVHLSGVRAHFSSCLHAIPLMQGSEGGLIVLISSFAGRQPSADVAYSCAHAAMDHMAACLAVGLKEEGIAAVSLAPGLVRTENVMHNQAFFDLSQSESPEFIGRAIAALAGDPKRMEKSGQWLVAAELAQEYGFTDVDGTQPPSLRSR